MLIAFQILGGFVLLIVGSEVLLRGASNLAAMLGMTPLVIGLTVVAFGTSSPELAVSIQSVFSDSANLESKESGRQQLTCRTKEGSQGDAGLLSADCNAVPQHRQRVPVLAGQAAGRPASVSDSRINSAVV